MAISGDADFCRQDGCQKKVLNKTGLCQEHRKTKCQAYGCKTIITSRQGSIYCVKHNKITQIRKTWGLTV